MLIATNYILDYWQDPVGSIRGADTATSRLTAYQTWTYSPRHDTTIKYLRSRIPFLLLIQRRQCVELRL